MKTKVICWYLIIIIRNWIDELIWFNEEAFHFLSFHLFSVKSWKQNNYSAILKLVFFILSHQLVGFNLQENIVFDVSRPFILFSTVLNQIWFSLFVYWFCHWIGLLIFFLSLKRLQCSQSYIFKTIMPDHE